MTSVTVLPGDLWGMLGQDNYKAGLLQQWYHRTTVGACMNNFLRGSVRVVEEVEGKTRAQDIRKSMEQFWV